MRRQYYDSPVKAQDMFIEDFDELWTIISDEVMNRTGDFFNKGVVEDITITIASGTELSLPNFTYYLDKNRIEVSAQDITIDTTTDGTYNLFADYTETIAERDESRERRITDKKHKRIEYTPNFSISSSSDDTKVKLAEITISGNTITNVDNSKRDKPIHNIIKDTAQDFVSTWSSQKIVNYIVSSLASANNPVIDTLNTPPGSPTDDDRYIIGASPTGDWSGQANNIAQWNTETDPDAWSFTTATQGMTVYHQSLGHYVVWNDVSWQRFENTISLDEIPNGSTYGKVKGSQSNEIDFSGGDLSFTNDAKTDIANPYLTEYVLPEGQMSDHAKDNTIVQGNQGSPVFGSKIYRVDTSVVETSVRWQSDLIPVRTDETLEFIISDTGHSNGSGEDIRIVLAERDKDYNYYNSKSETVSATDNSIRVSFTTSSSTVRYVYFRIYASETSNWGESGFWKFTNPIIRRKSKHGTEYTFRAKWTGNVNYTILENTDNKLSSISAGGFTVESLNINFESGFLHNDDIVTVMLGRIDSSNRKYYGEINNNGGSNIINNSKHKINDIINCISVGAYNTSDNIINICENIGSYENFVDVIIRKRG